MKNSPPFRRVSRRRFLAGSGMAVPAVRSALEAQTSPAPVRGGEFVIPPPRIITGGTRPLLEGTTARPLRYTPVDGDFLIRNGGEFFNRPLYGPNINFRVDSGDLPEYSLYLPGHGGNLRLGIAAASGAKWLSRSAEVTARYRPGRMIHEIRDPLLGRGALRIEALTAGEGAGLLLRIDARDLSGPVSLTWAFGGVSGRKGARNGDIGCEAEPVSRFFQARPEECERNAYEIEGTRAVLQSPAATLLLAFPAGSNLGIADAGEWEKAAFAAGGQTTARPILRGSVALGEVPLFMEIRQIANRLERPASQSGVAPFAARGKQIADIAGTLRMATPDPWIDATGPALAVAADAIWDSDQQCVMHGGVAWRGALVGWRGPYCLSALGNHERMKAHVRRWVKRQNVTPVPEGASPVTGPADAENRLARKERLLHQNGDLSGNHYDMNMVFFDVFLRSLRWTGDVEFAREIWPAFRRHLEWEERLFRRTFTSADGTELPLYEAYAVIWASDNLQYNGGGATHSSAYNVFAFRAAGMLARLVGDDPRPYEKEAELIAEGMKRHLWLAGQGAFAESKDLLGAQTVYHNPALWTVYHAIDSEICTPRQAWQMIAERLSVLRRIPVHGTGVPAGPWYMLSCSDWLPYIWSLNLLALAENAHMALAMWQSGMPEEAFQLLKGNLLDSLYMGLSPGNFHMTSALDAHRQEAQRDSGDPVGITARAITEGLFGLRPDLIAGVLTIRPGFPRAWDQASITHRDLDFSWRRAGRVDSYEVVSRLPKRVPLKLVVPAQTTALPRVTGAAGVTVSFDATAVGAPALVIAMPAASAWKVRVEWSGDAPAMPPAQRGYALGQALMLPPGVAPAQTDDPQGCLANGRVALPGFHTVFANMHVGDCRWSMPISFTVRPAEALPMAAPRIAPGVKTEPLDLSALLQHRITEIFTRPYDEPRSPYCSLAFPRQLLGGWANMDLTATIDDTGLRGARGMLSTAPGVPFRTPEGNAPNCLFLSQWKPDRATAAIPVAGKARGAYLLMTGVTFPQASRMEHGRVTAVYADGGTTALALKNPDTWWPIEQDYLLDDYLFIDEAPLPPRVDLRSGLTRMPEAKAFKGQGRAVPGGAATILYLPLDPARELASLRFEASLYGIVVALLGVTLARA